MNLIINQYIEYNFVNEPNAYIEYSYVNEPEYKCIFMKLVDPWDDPWMTDSWTTHTPMI